DLARHLRPLGAVAARVITDQAGIGAMLAHHRDLRLFGKRVLEAIGQPIGIGVTHHHDRGRGFRFLLRRWGSTRIIDGRLALPVWVVAPVGVEPAAEPVVVIVVLLLALRATAPVPELLRLYRQHQREADAGRHRDCKYSGLEGWGHDLSPLIDYRANSIAAPT